MSLRAEVERDIAQGLNRNSAENGSNTPDWILGEFLAGCLAAYDRAVTKRDSWYGVSLSPGVVVLHKAVPR